MMMRGRFGRQGSRTRAGSGAWLAVVLSVAVAFAGCAGGTAAPAMAASPTVPSSAAPAKAAADTGGIQGLVVDDEAVPLAGARVGLLERDEETVSAQDGSFSFSGLTPGVYRLAAEKLAYESAAKSADVVAGEITEVRFVLKALTPDIARTQSWIRQGFMRLGVGTPVAAQQVNVTGDAFYDWYQKVASGVMSAITGLEWTKNSAASASWMYFSIWKTTNQCGGECTRINWTEGRSPLVVRADDMELDGKNWEVNPYLLLRGPCGARVPPCQSTDADALVQVVVEQKFQIYLTVSYGENLPPDASPFPPK